jgi:two-component system cell cycle response regulator DivK
MATILIIEDNYETVRMVRKIMEPRGHSITHAPNGLEALKHARNVKFDIVLADLNLPDLEGKVVVNQMRFIPGYKQVPIVAFTAENSARSKRMALAFGCIDFISKPIDTRTFPERIEGLAAYGQSEITPA